MLDALVVFVFGLSISLLLLSREEESFELVRRLLMAALAVVVITTVVKLKVNGWDGYSAADKAYGFRQLALLVAGFVVGCGILFWDDQTLQSAAAGLSIVKKDARMDYQIQKRNGIKGADMLLGTARDITSDSGLDLRSETYVRLSMHVFGGLDRQLLSLVETHAKVRPNERIMVQRLAGDPGAASAKPAKILRQFKKMNMGNQAASRHLLMSVAAVAKGSGGLDDGARTRLAKAGKWLKLSDQDMKQVMAHAEGAR